MIEEIKNSNKFHFIKENLILHFIRNYKELLKYSNIQYNSFCIANRNAANEETDVKIKNKMLKYLEIIESLKNLLSNYTFYDQYK